MLLVCLSLGASAQQDFYGGLFPEAALSYKIGSNWKITHKVENQNGLFDTSKEQTWRYFYERTDLQSFVAYSISPFLSITAGYQYRLDSDANSHRSIQQLSYVQKGIRSRLGHRIRLDQTYGNDFLFRFRYRFSVEVPLSGLSVDPNEWYLKMSDEPIIGFEKGKTSLENRLAGAFGYHINDHHKIESGLDYRTDRWLADGFRHRLWYKISYYVNL
jgi:hypothetical protein